MPMKIRARRHSEEAGIILIPMIDTLIFLLMFLIVATLALAVQNGLSGNLSTVSVGERHVSQNLTLTLDAAGTLHLNAKPIALADETAELKALGVSAGTLVIINADANVKHGTVTSVMDNARKAGIERFAIATAS